ncbi:unnamed protein product [Amoebophrya sp. A120]|nr:unnamed protein product [Amoebophrya sp. A120]|eukprot:GSA120T00004830001.1
MSSSDATTSLLPSSAPSSATEMSTRGGLFQLARVAPKPELGPLSEYDLLLDEEELQEKCFVTKEQKEQRSDVFEFRMQKAEEIFSGIMQQLKQRDGTGESGHSSSVEKARAEATAGSCTTTRKNYTKSVHNGLITACYQALYQVDYSFGQRAQFQAQHLAEVHAAQQACLGALARLHHEAATQNFDEEMADINTGNFIHSAACDKFEEMAEAQAKRALQLRAGIDLKSSSSSSTGSAACSEVVPFPPDATDLLFATILFRRGKSEEAADVLKSILEECNRKLVTIKTTTPSTDVELREQAAHLTPSQETGSRLSNSKDAGEVDNYSRSECQKIRQSARDLYEQVRVEVLRQRKKAKKIWSGAFLGAAGKTELDRLSEQKSTSSLNKGGFTTSLRDTASSVATASTVDENSSATSSLPASNSATSSGASSSGSGSSSSASGEEDMIELAHVGPATKESSGAGASRNKVLKVDDKKKATTRNGTSSEDTNISTSTSTSKSYNFSFPSSLQRAWNVVNPLQNATAEEEDAYFLDKIRGKVPEVSLWSGFLEDIAAIFSEICNRRQKPE